MFFFIYFFLNLCFFHSLLIRLKCVLVTSYILFISMYVFSHVFTLCVSLHFHFQMCTRILLYSSSAQLFIYLNVCGVLVVVFVCVCVCTICVSSMCSVHAFVYVHMHVCLCVMCVWFIFHWYNFLYTYVFTFFFSFLFLMCCL